MRHAPGQVAARTAIGITIGALSLVAATLLPAADWPHFRGINRDGVSTESKLLASWPEKGPRELWRRPIGEGYSAISIAGGRLYTMYAGEQEGEPAEFAAAFDPATGDELWRTHIGKRHDTHG